MGHRALLSAILAVQVLGYGLTTRHAGTLASAAPSAGEPDGGKREASPDGEAQDLATTTQGSERVAFTECRPPNGRSEDVDWPDPPMPADIESGGPPVDLGELLEVDDA